MSKSNPTNTEILKRAIKKAIDGGWKIPSLLKALYANPSAAMYSLEGQHVEMVRGMITSHDFAKALWGSRWDENNGCKVHSKIHSSDSIGNDFEDPDYFHLREMVVAEDPIKYLGENI